MEHIIYKEIATRPYSLAVRIEIVILTCSMIVKNYKLSKNSCYLEEFKKSFTNRPNRYRLLYFQFCKPYILDKKTSDFKN